ncbi:3-phosphoshikimate 1-carboxyvinyltransferase [Archaeoglobus sp.]
MEVIVRKSEVEGEAKAPPSKSYTHRAFIAASLSPLCRISTPLISADTLATLGGCRKIGADVVRKDSEWLMRGVDEINSSGYFNFENSGTTLRIFTGILSLSTSPFFSVLDGDSSLRKRPNRELALALRELGAEVYGDEDFRAPIKIRGVLRGGEVEMEAASSQFISSLLFSLPMAKQNSVLRVKRVKSQPYINITLDVLESSGVRVERDGNEYHISGEQRFRLRKYAIPADFSSASYLIAAGLLAGEVRITNVFDSEQGDKRIIEICREMSGDIRWDRSRGVVVAKKSELEGVEIDAADIPDLVPTISILAATAKGETRIYNAEHLRIKEIDRIEGIVRNLKSLNVQAKATADGLIIKGGKRVFKGTVNSFGDHRMALAFSLLGLLGEVRCVNAGAVSVSFPGFFDILKALGADVVKL